jgi:hypothetical protein
MTSLDNMLGDIVIELRRIADALEYQNKPKGLGSSYKYNSIPCELRDEKPLPTPWNNTNKVFYRADNIDNL